MIRRHWDRVWQELVNSPEPLTNATLSRRLGIDGDTLSGLLYKKTKDGTLKRTPIGPRGGYGYEPVTRPRDNWAHLLEDPLEKP